MGKKVLFTYDYGKEKMNSIRELGYDVVIMNEEGLIYDENLEDVEIMASYNPFDSLKIEKMKHLKWVQLFSIGIDQLPLDFVKKAGITVTNNKGGYSIPMGEWVIMNILELMKNSNYFFKNQQNKRWKMSSKIIELFHKKVAFIGTGSIAVESAKRLQGFEAEVIGVNTTGKAVKYFDRCYSLDNIDSVLCEADAVVLTIPHTEKTHHLINNEKLNKMKKGSYLVNVSRGSIIDEKSLVKHLENGKLKGAALDVFEEEPLDEKSPLWNLENLIITPHNSWISEMRNERRWQVVYENLSRYARGEELINVVDLNKGY